MEISLAPTPASIRVASQWMQAHKRFPYAADRACEFISKGTVEIVKKVITSQNFRRVPLKANWVARKRARGLDPRILIATKQYLKSYRHYRVGPRNWAVTCDLAKMKLLEYGTRKSPKRPHWEPVIKAVNAAAPVIFAQQVLKELGLG